jgi:flagellar biosynthesis/type III secretory pathway protein FliH
MSNGIYLTLEQYKDKDLPITITINGHTYHSQFALATAQTTWFEMGKQHGMELGSDNTYSDNEMSNMHDAWFDEGYTKGYEAGYGDGYTDGKKEATLEKVDQFNKGYEIGKYDGYEQCKHDGISKINLNTESVEQTELSKEYDKGFTKGYAEGYSDAKEGGQAEGYKDGPEQTEYAKGYAEGKEAGYEEGFERGFMDLRFLIKK